MTSRRVQIITAAIVAAIAAAFVIIWLISRRLPDPPSLAEFDKLSEDEQCNVTSPRAERCTNELMVAQLRALMEPGSDDPAMKALEKDLKSSPSEGDEADIHRVACLDSPNYARAVLTCWNVDDCDAFAACVVKDWFSKPRR